MIVLFLLRWLQGHFPVIALAEFVDASGPSDDATVVLASSTYASLTRTDVSFCLRYDGAHILPISVDQLKIPDSRFWSGRTHHRHADLEWYSTQVGSICGSGNKSMTPVNSERHIRLWHLRCCWSCSWYRWHLGMPYDLFSERNIGYELVEDPVTFRCRTDTGSLMMSDAECAAGRLK